VQSLGYATADCFGTAERTRVLADLFVALAEQPAVVRTAEAQGWADAATQAALRAAVRVGDEAPAERPAVAGRIS
jgi:hypothetical protein